MAREGVLRKLLHGDDLVLKKETIGGFRNKFIKWQYFESKSKKVNLRKPKCGLWRHYKGWLVQK